jgi:asparagine synthase (glutamine-hydrolysing)
MCGVVGLFLGKTRPTEKLQKLVAQGCELLRHRGPDDSGVFQFPGGLLAHTRLSILDTSGAGHQPMVTADGRYALVFNGEIYNFRELRDELIEGGLRFSTGTDTEVLLKGFGFWREDLFRRLNGMYAFVIVDIEDNEAWLCRDRFGIKPLYYFHGAAGFMFASEIKSLRQISEHPFDLNYKNLTEFSYYGQTFGEETLFDKVNSLGPGCWMHINLDSLECNRKQYWSIRNVKEITDTSDVVKVTQNLLEKAVQRQLVSDVPVGVFLSGGIDSSAITAFASRHYEGKLNTYSARFDFDKGVNELPQARKVAEYFGTEHHELSIAGHDVADVVEKMVDHHDLPFSDAANIPLYLLAKEANKAGAKVILQGDGGDELFGGYNRHTILSLYHCWSFLVPAASAMFAYGSKTNRTAQRIQRLLFALNQSDPAKLMGLLLTVEDPRDHPENIFQTAVLEKHIQKNPFERFHELEKEICENDLLQKMLWMDAQIILPDVFLEKVDRATMAASVEVRVPFLDNELAEFVLGLSASKKVPLGRKKHLLKKALRGVLPDSILDSPKKGFGVPFGYWIKGALRDLLFDTLHDLESSRASILDAKKIEELHAEHVSGNADHGFILWKALNFALWSKKFGVF